jgi:AraC family transcriptional regulator of adaptative response/methylated-DNA-[protein]-cysteine methyltransferase
VRARAGDTPLLDQLRVELSEYFRGERTDFDLPLHAPGTSFQMRVWDELRRIPIGATTSYARLAESIGHPAAVRAVARANGDNRIAIIIPCHRVIGSDGSLTGYGGGLWRKKKLLELEARVHELPLFERL